MSEELTYLKQLNYKNLTFNFKLKKSTVAAKLKFPVFTENEL
jgi:hypothetical protein